MKKFLTVLAAGAMGVALVGCGSSAPKDSGAPASDATSSTANTSTSTGKRVSLAKENDAISLDSSYATDGMSLEMIAASIEGLETMDKDGNPIPAIAESYDVSDDELTYTFHLRDAN